MPEIWIAGAPSFVGGADTELYHQIILWRKHNIDVHIVPNTPNSMVPAMIETVQNIGCTIEQYSPSVFDGKVVVSYCNGPALDRLPEISKFKPRAFIWFNCMTWTFNPEIAAIREGWITHLGFVSEYQKNYLINEYSKQLPEKQVDGSVQFGVNGFPQLFEYRPYLDIAQFDVLTKTDEYFGVGRVSRADTAKYSDDCWRIFDRVLTPVPKKTYILGYSTEVEKKIGPPPISLDWQWWTAGAIPTKEFFSKIDVMIHKTGGSRESYCRVLVEAMAHGVVPLVERNYAFPEILSKSEHLSKFIMCDSSDEMSFKASQLAFNKPLLSKLKSQCRSYAEENFSDDNIVNSWLKVLSE